MIVLDCADSPPGRWIPTTPRFAAVLKVLRMAVYELERERKLEVAEGFLLPELPGERLRTVTLVSAYHDTPDRRLAAAGITLRRRTRARSVRWWRSRRSADFGRLGVELGPRRRRPTRATLACI